ncbi:MAG: shikimate dehydrogenase [Actinobacteria bacterium]|nr:shikimate dehydrogenase [Actinomycetota bacterium]
MTGRTRYAAVVGHPVEHSLSPAVHNAAFAALGLDWRYVAVSVPPGRAADAVGLMREAHLGGLSVTMPHKEPVVGLVDDLTPAAAALGAVNCVWWRDLALVGDNTDGEGFLDFLREDEGFDPEAKRVVVLGAGGAGRAVVRALARAGADVTVVNRTQARAEAAAALAGERGRAGRVEDVASADLVVNATPVGMSGDARLPLDAELLGPGQLVVDIVYEPALTPLLAAARDRGAVAVNGLGMLIHQAAHAFRRWTGEDPPVEVMSAVAVAELSRRKAEA